MGCAVARRARSRSSTICRASTRSPGIRRFLDVVVTDGIGLENTIARLRVLISATAAATNLLKVGEFEERLAALESVIDTGGQRHPGKLAEVANSGPHDRLQRVLVTRN